MKRCGFAWLLILAAATGCVTLPRTVQPPFRDSEATAETPARPKRPPAITADQVTEVNAREMTRALLEELERDQAGDRN
jgi:hypothetical protein